MLLIVEFKDGITSFMETSYVEVTNEFEKVVIQSKEFGTRELKMDSVSKMKLINIHTGEVLKGYLP